MRTDRKNNIILIGFMGSGKSTMSIKLSHKLRRIMIDTDQWIEQKQNMQISEIFSAKGEDYFRQLETECLKELIATEDNRIIAVGGGLPIKEENHGLLQKLGVVIYLKVSAEEVLLRLQGDHTRPLLQPGQGSENDPRPFDPQIRIGELLEKRETVYEKLADAIIDTTGKDTGDILDHMIKVVKSVKRITKVSKDAT